jgi:hypothetical protein
VPENGVTYSGIPYWDDRDDPLAWDTLWLGDEMWPGLVEISGAGVSRKIDVKKAKDTDGATIKDEGYQPAKLTITVTIYSLYQWGELQRLLPTVHPRRKGGTRTPLDIVNPQANLLGINQIYIDKIAPPKKPGRGDGLCSITMSAIEWVASPKPVTSGAGSPGNAAQMSPADEEMNALQQALTAALIAQDYDAAADITEMMNQVDYS